MVISEILSKGVSLKARGFVREKLESTNRYTPFANVPTENALRGTADGSHGY